MLYPLSYEGFGFVLFHACGYLEAVPAKVKVGRLSQITQFADKVPASPSSVPFNGYGHRTCRTKVTQVRGGCPRSGCSVKNSSFSIACMSIARSRGATATSVREMRARCDSLGRKATTW